MRLHFFNSAVIANLKMDYLSLLLNYSSCSHNLHHNLHHSLNTVIRVMILCITDTFLAKKGQCKFSETIWIRIELIHVFGTLASWYSDLLIFPSFWRKAFSRQLRNLPRIALYVWTLLMLLQCPPVVGTGLIFAYDKSWEYQFIWFYVLSQNYVGNMTENEIQCTKKGSVSNFSM